MIERKIVQQKIKGYVIENYISSTLNRVGHSKTRLFRNPLGEKIVISAMRPGLIVGSKGSNIKKLTKVLKAKFKLDNPQIEMDEVRNANLDPQLISEHIASSLERFGTARFKGVGYKCLGTTMAAGALGVEILISGKIPSSRAKRWRFYMGYLKKCGDAALAQVLTAYNVAKLKTGVVGIQVRVMPPNIVLPDAIEVNKDLVVQVTDEDTSADVTSEAKAESEKIADDSANLQEIKKKVAKKKTTKKTTKKAVAKKAKVEEAKEEVKEEVKEEEKPVAEVSESKEE